MDAITKLDLDFEVSGVQRREMEYVAKIALDFEAVGCQR